MPTIRYPEDETIHGRLELRYLRGETPARYGVARRTPCGKLEFVNEFSYEMRWMPNQALVRANPIDLSGYGDNCFSVNFAKETSPVTLGENVSKYNWKVQEK